jgi:hypothetical protein
MQAVLLANRIWQYHGMQLWTLLFRTQIARHVQYERIMGRSCLLCLILESDFYVISYLAPELNFVISLSIVVNFDSPLWSSGQSFWLQIQRSGFDSRHYHSL